MRCVPDCPCRCWGEMGWWMGVGLFVTGALACVCAPAGGSAGSAMVAALEAAKTLKAGQRCVVLLADGVRNYMSKFLNNDWMWQFGYVPTCVRRLVATGGRSPPLGLTRCDVFLIDGATGTWTWPTAWAPRTSPWRVTGRPGPCRT